MSVAFITIQKNSTGVTWDVVQKEYHESFTVAVKVLKNSNNKNKAIKEAKGLAEEKNISFISQGKIVITIAKIMGIANIIEIKPTSNLPSRIFCKDKSLMEKEAKELAEHNDDKIYVESTLSNLDEEKILKSF